MVMREYAHPSKDFDILYDGRMGPLHKALTQLSAAALGRRRGGASYTAERTAPIARTVSASVLAALGFSLPVAEGEKP